MCLMGRGWLVSRSRGLALQTGPCIEPFVFLGGPRGFHHCSFRRKCTAYTARCFDVSNGGVGPGAAGLLGCVCAACLLLLVQHACAYSVLVAPHLGHGGGSQGIHGGCSTTAAGAKRGSAAAATWPPVESRVRPSVESCCFVCPHGWTVLALISHGVALVAVSAAGMNNIGLPCIFSGCLVWLHWAC
jgi:hypothetical protein